MAKSNNQFHVKKDGTVGVCQAKKRMCPLGGDNEHFNTKEEAQAYSDKKYGDKYKHKTFVKREEKEVKVNQEEDYKSKLKSCSVYHKDFDRGKLSFHYAKERRDRRKTLDKIIGKGKTVETFIIDDGRVDKNGKRQLQIHEVKDNGRIVVYSNTDYTVVTEFLAKRNRIEGLFAKAGETASNRLLNNVDRSQRKMKAYKSEQKRKAKERNKKLA